MITPMFRVGLMYIAYKLENLRTEENDPGPVSNMQISWPREVEEMQIRSQKGVNGLSL
jgi:hypothetical protein